LKIVPILNSSRTTYIDSLTGQQKVKSGESSEELKITGKPEPIQNDAPERVRHSVRLAGYYKGEALYGVRKLE
jgi:hypothetical protein